MSPILADAYKEIQAVVFFSLVAIDRFVDGPLEYAGWIYGTLGNGSAVKAKL